MFYTDTLSMSAWMFINRLLLLVICTGLMACSTFKRSWSSGYTTYSDEGSYSATKEYFAQKTHEKIKLAKEELAIPTDRPLTEQERSLVHYRILLNEYEDALSTPAEKTQYYELKPYFKNDRERILFLRQPTFEARKNWALNHNIEDNEENYTEDEMEAIDSNDIVTGMTKTAVKLSWGEPDSVEVAGDSMYSNEKWNYKKYISSPDGYHQETRVIIFESGRVAGWERY